MKNFKILHAIAFAAEKHKLQRRKGWQRIPYINHPVKVAAILHNAGEEDESLLNAAILHDVLEDTDTSENELESLFGTQVLSIVKEVTDDKSLPKSRRKALQIEKASYLSDEAKKLKIADKINNIEDIMTLPIRWSTKRKYNYLLWCKQVIDQCKGKNKTLDNQFDAVYDEGMKKLIKE